MTSANAAEKPRLENFARSARLGEKARVLHWAGEGLETQAPKVGMNVQKWVRAEELEPAARKLDQVAAVGASYSAWLREHPHQEHPHYSEHKPHPVHLEPLHPWPTQP